MFLSEFPTFAIHHRTKKMQTLTIKQLELAGVILSDSNLEKLLEEQCNLVSLEQINWNQFPYKPDVKFRIAHTGNTLLLKYYVREKSIQAKVSTINGDVYKDSCVEFFISPFADGNYYNFEFNCIGVPHVGYGDGRHNRQLLSVEVLKKIKTYSTLGTEPFIEKQGDFSWELFVQIPLSCFVNNSISQLNGIEAKGNFYKCGDDLSEPHFVTWNPVKTENPDYHCPEFFGEIRFE